MPASTEITLTPAGREKLVKELEWREGERHDEIVEAIREARSQGDLSENAEYDAAKEDQSQNESRINEIRKILEVAKVAELSVGGETAVSIGATVELTPAGGKMKGKKFSFTIVGTTETDSLAHKISNESPMGQALIGHVAGDVISYTAPDGKERAYEIVSVTRD